MKVLINYADSKYKYVQKICSYTGYRKGKFDKVIEYSPKDIDRDFYKANEEILNLSRGGGYWLWKPYIVNKALSGINYGDYLFYCDSGAFFIRSIDSLISCMEENKQEIMIFEMQNLKEAEWTKRDTFILMNCDSSKYTETFQRLATCFLIKKTEFVEKYFQELLDYSTDYRLITDMTNTLGEANYPAFKEHRHDQSIFSLLSKRYNIIAFRDPSQYGNNYKRMYSSSKYEQIIVIHRKRSNVINLMKIILRNTLWELKLFLNSDKYRI